MKLVGEMLTDLGDDDAATRPFVAEEGPPSTVVFAMMMLLLW